jgi:hypothetical protein
MASPNATIAIHLILRGQFRKKGYSFDDTNWAMATLAYTPGLLDGAVQDSGQADALAAAEAAVTPAQIAEAKAAGGGGFAAILAALMTFLESPQGQAIIGSLFTMLIGALGHSKCFCTFIALLAILRGQRNDRVRQDDSDQHDGYRRLGRAPGH